MKFVYKPEGADRREWDFDPNRILNVEAEAIERETGLTWAEVTEQLGKGSIRAIHGVLWVLLKRSTPTLKYADVQFRLDEIDFEVDEADAAAILAVLDAKMAGGEELTPSERAVYDRLVEQGATAASDLADPKG